MKKRLIPLLATAGLMLPLLVSAATLSDEDGDVSLDARCPEPTGERASEGTQLDIERAAIRETMSNWAATVREADVEALALLVTEDAEFWTHGAAPLIGREALKEAFEPFFAGYELEQDFDCQELVIAGEWAFMRGMERNRMVPRDGSESLLQRQRAFSLMRRQADGTWLFARGMTNLPPEE